MCGIAGYFGRNSIPKTYIDKTLQKMKERGPDFSNSFSKSYPNNLFIYLLHSRLSIIDLHPRSNQPFVIGDHVIIFNGEIYNYLELKKHLINKKIKLKTNSDTEILLHYFIIYGEKCVDHFEGMWSFAIYNTKKQELFFSRDRFAEKPLYYYENKNGIFFGSEIQYLSSLSGKNFSPNLNMVNKFLSLGYRSLFKGEDTFFIEAKKLLNAENLYCNNSFKLNIKKYWSPEIKINYKLSINDAIERTKELLIDSVRLRMRSDVPLAFCLSGGVDSSGLASIAVKEFNYKIKTFSIIDSDDRYNEINNINVTVNDLNCDSEIIKLSKDNFLENLKNLTQYRDGPVFTISQYLHSLLLNSINKRGCKVVISGSAADEIFSGYYDHFLLHLSSLKDTESYNKNLFYWKKFIYDFIRNPNLKKPDLFLKNPRFRDYLYEGSDEISNFLLKPFSNNFDESFFTKNLFSNRRLNELFHETTAPTLNQEDLNSMKYSVENRSPYLDKKLVEFAFSIPEALLIQKGYGKYILRESLKGILNDKVRLDREKKGFNASINSLLNFDNKKTRDCLLDSSSPIFDLVDVKKFEKLLKNEHIPNYKSKFIFNFVSAKIFLESIP
jgi:asparagine synthase (glutamine-hydrolysing)